MIESMFAAELLFVISVLAMVGSIWALAGQARLLPTPRALATFAALLVIAFGSASLAGSAVRFADQSVPTSTNVPSLPAWESQP